MYKKFPFLIFLALSFLCYSSVFAATFTINSIADTSDSSVGNGICNDGLGNCTLRAAIEEANATTGTSSLIINFEIASSGVQVISPSVDLPAITRANVTLDGSTEDGSSCGNLWSGVAPVWNIVLHKPLWFQASGFTLRGMDISVNTSTNGVAISGPINGGTVQCNYLHGNDAGLDVADNNSSPQTNITIGGLLAGQGNLISNNTNGMKFINTGLNTILIAGNFIGTNATGSVGNGNTDPGIDFHDGATNITITHNLISRNGRGMRLKGVNQSIRNVVITNNYIGTDRTGMIAIPNETGILFGSAFGVVSSTIGGTTSADRNIISGNTNEGIEILDSADIGNVIVGNYIGLTADGARALGNGNGITDSGTGTIIGGTSAGARNIIAGSSGFGAGILLQGTGAVVRGNYIGTDVSGNATTSSLGNTFGVRIIGSNNTIGGTSVAVRNIIGNGIFDGFGIPLGSGVFIQNAASNTISGNYIGMAANGTTALPNEYGILILGTSSTNNTIGGTLIGSSNIIVNNTKAGVVLGGDPGFGIGPAGTGNAIFGNKIFHNGSETGLGIDLSANPNSFMDAATPNDVNDADTGPNNLQNSPVLTSVTVKGGITTILGTLNSNANTIYRIEFFSNSSLDPSGYAEGETYLGFTIVTTNASGNASFSATGLPAIATGTVLTGTATSNATKNTSEFSKGIIVSSIIPMQDLTIQSITNGGTSRQLKITACNIGGQLTYKNAPPVDVTANGVTKRVTFSRANLGAGECGIVQKLYSTWGMIKGNAYNVTAIMDPANVIPELSETNNTATASIIVPLN